MANPYHDGEGKFCSRGEMQTAIENLVHEHRYDEALELIQDFKKVDEKADLGRFHQEHGLVRSKENMEYAEAIIAGQAKGFINLQNASDEQIKEVSKLLHNERKTYLIGTYNPAMAEFESLSDELQAKTGIRDFDRLKDYVATEKIRLDTEGVFISNAVKEEAEKNGLPQRYSGYYFKKLNTDIGVAPSFTNAYNRGSVYRPETTPPISKETFPVKVKDKEQRAIIQNAVNTVFAQEEIQERVKDFNDGLIAVKGKEEIIDEYRHTLGGQGKSKLSEIRQKAHTLHSVIGTAEAAVAWRKQVREAGVKTNSALPHRVSTLKGSELTTDKDGNINNAWIVNSNIDTGTKSLDKVTSIEATGGIKDSGVLVGKSGRTYSSSTHYANYKTQRDEVFVIIDDTVKGSKPYSTITNFSNITDSGD